MAETLAVWRGDITTLAVDAIVNAANRTLLGGGGVDGAIHRAAGPALRDHCARLGGCPTGEARITPGFALKARWVIHTVGPVWNGGTHGEMELLAACYRASLALAAEHGARTVAFPSVSTGAYGFPLHLAGPIAVREVRAGVRRHDLEQVTFVCFDERAEAAYRREVGHTD